MAQIFLSYARSDRDFVLKLIGAFTVYGITYWYDERTDYGDEWWNAIEQEIKSCEYFLLIMSPDSADSRWVQREVHVADAHGKKLRLILLRGEPFSMFLGNQFFKVKEQNNFVDESFFRSIHGYALPSDHLEAEKIAIDFDSKAAVENKLGQLALSLEEPASIFELSLAATNGNKKIADIVTKALLKAKKTGPVHIQRGHCVNTQIESVSGIEVDEGFLSPHLITDLDNNITEFDNPLVLVSDQHLTSMGDVLSPLESAAKLQHPIVFFAPGYTAEVLATFVINNERDTVKICAIQVSDASVLSDLAYITNTRVFSVTENNSLTKKELGETDKFIATINKTTVIGGSRTLKNIQDQLQEKGLARISHTRCDRIKTGVVVVRVGGNTVLEVRKNTALVKQAHDAVKGVLVVG